MGSRTLFRGLRMSPSRTWRCGREWAWSFGYALSWWCCCWRRLNRCWRSGSARRNNRFVILILILILISLMKIYFDHEKLQVCQEWLQFYAWSEPILERVQKTATVRD